jgi:hypothetical protein
MNYDRPRVDWLRLVVWTPLLLFGAVLTCSVLAGAFAVMQAAWEAAGPWITDHIDGVVAVIVTAGVGAIVVLSRKDGRR